MYIMIMLLIWTEANAGDWAFRARENFEWIQISDASSETSGLSSTINFGYEDTYNYSFMIGLNPGLGSFELNRFDAVLGDEVRLYQLGVDYKVFPVDGHHGFLRSTVFYSLIDTKTIIDHIGGYGASLSLGWEFWLFDLFSLAPELGYKSTRLRTDQNLDVIFVSVGLHFYNFNLLQSR